jgi:integrase/recombinase XerD
MSRLVRLKPHRPIPTIASAVAAFLVEHDLSSGSQRVYAGALRTLQDDLGADTALALLDKPGAPERFAAWFHGRYDRTAPATRVRQLAILRSACAFWRRRAWLSTDPTVALERPNIRVDRTRALTRDQLAAL